VRRGAPTIDLMRPIVTPEEMKAIDATAVEPVEVLIERAGAAVARAAVRLLGGSYGRRVAVIAGRGNNGNDARVAARRLAAAGIVVTVYQADGQMPAVIDADLVIDGAYGTGFHGEWTAPQTGTAIVLAVDIPSGVDGRTGAAGAGVLTADHTVTFAALKPGLVLEPGASRAGTIEIADIGLNVDRARLHLIEAADIADWLPQRATEAHKWQSAVSIVAGSKGMGGAAYLAAASAQRTGAGMVRLGTPGVDVPPRAPVEAVTSSLPPSGWASDVLAELGRIHALLIGPGLGRVETTSASVRHIVLNAPTPLVLDGDGLYAFSPRSHGDPLALRQRPAPTVLTPHDGEYRLLTGESPDPDRLTAVRRLAFDSRAIVLLKGPTTLVAEPGGNVFAVRAGDARLATAGTGDVLAGILTALLGEGMAPMQAAAAAAFIHGAAGRLCSSRGLVASDLIEAIPRVFADLSSTGGVPATPAVLGPRPLMPRRPRPAGRTSSSSRHLLAGRRG
jgi:ADP-dependent NAD(P)H-hydrate dehydratase / NAD(P)H-hydrate epimerase